MRNYLKTILALGLASLSLTAAPSANAAPLSTWYGTFQWEESLGRIGGSTPAEGAAAFVTYTLSLGPNAGSTGCQLKGEGFQTYEQMQCTATPQGEAVIIKFYKFGATARGRYAMGAPLFTINRTEGGLITRLQALQPSSRATPNVGRLFRRIG